MTTTAERKASIFLPFIRLLRLIRRGLYGLRAYIPGLSFAHKCEKMVGPVGYWKELQQYQFNALRSNGLKPEHYLLDLGCGPLQGGISFIRYLDVSRYTGVDLAAGNLNAAYRQISLHQLASKNPRLIQSANFGAECLGDAAFDFIWVSQLLYLFDEETMAGLLAFVSRRLRPGGKFLGDIINPERLQSVSSHYSDFVPYTLESIQRLAQSEGLKVRSLGEILQYQYPSRLTLKQSWMLEFTKA